MGGGKDMSLAGIESKIPLVRIREKCTPMRTRRLWLELLTMGILHCLREDMRRRGRVGAISDDNQARIEHGRLSNEYFLHVDSFYTLYYAAIVWQTLRLASEMVRNLHLNG